MAKRAFLIVLDSFGIGGAADANKFGDAGSNTLASISKSPNFKIKNLLPEKTPKIVCNFKTLNIKTLQPKIKKCAIFLTYLFFKTYYWCPLKFFYL